MSRHLTNDYFYSCLIYLNAFKFIIQLFIFRSNNKLIESFYNIWKKHLCTQGVLLHSESTLISWKYLKKIIKLMKIWNFFLNLNFSNFFSPILSSYLSFFSLSFLILIIIVCLAKTSTILLPFFTSTTPTLLLLLLTYYHLKTRSSSFFIYLLLLKMLFIYISLAL